MIGKALWLIAAMQVCGGRARLACRALLGVPGEVVIDGGGTVGNVEVRGPVALRLRGGTLTLSGLLVRGGSTVDFRR